MDCSCKALQGPPHAQPLSYLPISSLSSAVTSFLLNPSDVSCSVFSCLPPSECHYASQTVLFAAFVIPSILMALNIMNFNIWVSSPNSRHVPHVRCYMKEVVYHLHLEFTPKFPCPNLSTTYSPWSFPPPSAGTLFFQLVTQAKPFIVILPSSFFFPLPPVLIHIWSLVISSDSTFKIYQNMITRLPSPTASSWSKPHSPGS